MSGAWVRIKYISERTGRPVWHTGHYAKKANLMEVFQRYHIDPDKMLALQVNGADKAPTKAELKTIF
jgi:hypothetical protein